MEIPKYSKIENERRWLIPSSYANSLRHIPYKKIDDLYLNCGRLRLRAITDSQTGKLEYKLCKKYGSISKVAEPIVNIYLTVEEYAAFSTLPGFKLTKRRYKKIIESVQYSFDIYDGELSGLILCEAEANSEDSLNKISGPDIFDEEVTENPALRGGQLCRLSPLEIKKILNR